MESRVACRTVRFSLSGDCRCTPAPEYGRAYLRSSGIEPWPRSGEDEVMAILDDVRFALRLLRKAPGATAGSIVSLALGIGATTAVSSLVEVLLLNPFPAIRDPERL